MRRLSVIGLTILLVLAVSGLAGATNITAKAFGMGGAFTGIANDVSSVIYNPAGLSQSGYLGFQFNGGFYTPGVDEFDELEDVVSYIDDNEFKAENNPSQTADNVQTVLDKFPSEVKFDGQALLGANFKSFGLAVNVDDKFTADSGNSSVRVENMATTEGIISLGKRLTSPPLNLGTLLFGVNFKVIRTDYAKYKLEYNENNWDNPDQNRTTEVIADDNSLGVDVGALARVTDLVTIGVQIRNLWAQDYTLKDEAEVYEFNGTSWVGPITEKFTKKDSPDRVMRVGASAYIPVINTTVAADVNNVPLLTEDDRESVVHFGFEKNLFWNGISLRGGTFKPEDSLRVYTVGLGLNLWVFHVDMAAASDDGFDDSVGGVVAANVKF